MTTPTAISPGATPWDAESWPWTETVWLDAGIEDIGNGHWRGKGAPRPGETHGSDRPYGPAGQGCHHWPRAAIGQNVQSRPGPASARVRGAAHPRQARKTSTMSFPKTLGRLVAAASLALLLGGCNTLLLNPPR